MMRKEKTMNNNREIRVMIFEPGKAPYTAVLEDSLEHRKALVGGEIECISLPHETVLCCNAGGKWMGLPVNRQFGSDTDPRDFLSLRRHPGGARRTADRGTNRLFPGLLHRATAFRRDL